MLTFGGLIRAARLGYHPFDERMLLRIEDGPSDTWIVECWPLDLIPQGKRSRDSSHRIWWQSPETMKVIRDLPFIRIWREKDGPRTFVVNDNGDLL